MAAPSTAVGRAGWYATHSGSRATGGCGGDSSEHCASIQSAPKSADGGRTPGWSRRLRSASSSVSKASLCPLSVPLGDYIYEWTIGSLVSEGE